MSLDLSWASPRSSYSTSPSSATTGTSSREVPQRGQHGGVGPGPRGVRRQGRGDLGRLLAGVVREGGRLESGALEASGVHRFVHDRDSLGEPGRAGGVGVTGWTMLDDAAWSALTAVLTVLGALWTWCAWRRRRGSAAGLRGARDHPAARGRCCSPAPCELVTGIVDAVVDWATSPGVQPAGVVRRRCWPACRSCCSWSRAAMAARRAPARHATTDPKKVPRRKRDALPPTASREGRRPSIDDDLADIEAILKKRGIT